MTHRTNTGYSLLFTISEDRDGETVQPPHKGFKGEFKSIQLAAGTKSFSDKSCGAYYTVLVGGQSQVRFFE
ncbi:MULTISPECIES: hypothetical protein [unclassified Microcoleus]|uniref:hypothetical protein n=1 Tax=unclassified Microcoleus TaxID=2642155 RepID=UPI002FD51634